MVRPGPELAIAKDHLVAIESEMGHRRLLEHILLLIRLFVEAESGTDKSCVVQAEQECRGLTEDVLH